MGLGESGDYWPYLLIVQAVIFWWLALFIISRMSGWTRLAEHYASEESFDGARRHFQSMSMGRGTLMDVNLANCVTFAINPQAFRISLLFPFRPHHPPLVIPLDEIAVTPYTFLRFFKGVTITTQRAPELKLNIMQSQARWLADNSQGRWPAAAESGSV